MGESRQGKSEKLELERAMNYVIAANNPVSRYYDGVNTIVLLIV